MNREVSHLMEPGMDIGLVVFDWAGTLVDFGCRAPTAAFLAAFAEVGLPSAKRVRATDGGAQTRHVREILVKRRLPDECAASYGRT
jgi:phosphonoacetaldehyde hydrolase